jgi:transcriptional regulator with XRE-family HTH domain
MNIAQRIKDLRLSKHLTQKELAQLLNVKPTTVSGWELGRNEPSIDTLKDLARIFGVSVDYMAGVTESLDKDKTTIDLENDPVVLSYGGRPVSEEDMDIIKAILERHKNDGDVHYE